MPVGQYWACQNVKDQRIRFVPILEASTCHEACHPDEICSVTSLDCIPQRCDAANFTKYKNDLLFYSCNQ